MRTSVLPIALLACAVLSSGCVVAAGAVGGYAAVKYLGNQVVRAYPGDVRSAYEATLAVLPELGYPGPHQATLGPTEARIAAGGATVAIAQYPGGGVRVAVRVGTFETSDHQRRALLIHERLAARLGTQP